MKHRKNVKDLTPSEITALVNAFLALKNSATHPSTLADAQADGALSRYDDYVWMHMVVGNGAHKGPAFFPWHRELLKRLEQELQAAAGDSDLKLPYWDWERARLASDPGWPFTIAFLGEDGNDADDDKVTTGPFAFSTGDWTLNVITGNAVEPGKDNVNYLRRRMNEDPSYLPSPSQTRNSLNVTPYDGSPWDNTVPNNSSFRKYYETVIHDPVHVWVGGCMRPMTSPNDPLFWLHHCNVDRHWAVWQQRYPAQGYLPSGMSGPAGHKLNDNMATFTQYFGVNVKPADTLNHHALGYWYDTDLPEITLETPSINFGDVSTGLTQYRAIRFKIRTCRETRLRFTTLPSGNFDTTILGTSITVSPVESEEFLYVNLWVQFTSAGALNVQQVSSVTVQGYIIDNEGYYSGIEGNEYIVLQNTVVNLSARPVADLTYAIGLALDRSGSMASTAFGTSTRAQVLKDAVSTFSNLMGAADGIGIVRYDHEVNRLFDITAMGPVMPVTPNLGRDRTNQTVSGNSLDPRGATSIGGGIIEARDMINDGAAGYNRSALVVLTDGLENTPPMIDDAAGSINSKTFAIGIGSSSTVSTDALKKITSNNEGYLLLTGNLSSTERQFLVTKYFIQILADITNNSIIKDPYGELMIGSEQKIPFKVTEADVRFEAIVLSPFARLIDFSLETPSGNIIDSNSPAFLSAVSFYMNDKDAFYSVKLPLLIPPSSENHKGTWQAIFRLDQNKIKAVIRENKELAEFLRRGNRTLPYSFLTKVYSNLNLNVALTQKSSEPGSEIIITASLTEYGIPMQTLAAVRAEITKPDLSTSVINLKQSDEAEYVGKFTCKNIGVYSFRIIAEGYTIYQTPFTREKTLTAGISDESGSENNLLLNYLRSRDEKLCHLFKCIFSDKIINPEVLRFLKEKGIDIENLKKCFDQFCLKRNYNLGGESTDSDNQLSIGKVIPDILGNAEISLLLDAIELGRKNDKNQFGFAIQPEPIPVEDCCCEDDESYEHGHEKDKDEDSHGPSGEGHSHNQEHQHKEHHDVNCPKITKEERDAHKFHVFEVVEEEIEKAKEHDRMLEEKRKKRGQSTGHGHHDVFEISDEEEMKKAHEEDEKKKKSKHR